jgi:hypothetical protein
LSRGAGVPHAASSTASCANGQASPDWVESVWKHYFKVKYKRRDRGDPRVLAQYIGPPPEKDPLTIYVPDLREIDCRNGFVEEPLRPIIEELAR